MFSDLEKALVMLEALIKELRVLNENLSQFKEMIAPYVGWRVVNDKKEKE